MVLKLLSLFSITISIVISCQNLPTKPSYNNPFDTKNPQTQGDPFKLRAHIKNGKIILTWSEVRIKNVLGYNIYRSTDEPENFIRLDSTVVGDTSWVDSSVDKGHSYWYKVTAFRKGGEESSQTNVTPVQINTEPVVIINGDDQYTPNRRVNLTILAPMAVEMWISNYSDFRDGNWEPYANSKTWDLLSGENIKTVYVKVKYNDGSESLPFYDTIQLVKLLDSPMVYVPAGEFTMGSRDGVGDSDEHPQHKIYLEAYWIDSCEVNNAQYAQFLTYGHKSRYHPGMKIIDNGDGTFVPEPGYEFHPVIYVTYEDAMTYANWRGRSLPTEAQWEKAARGSDLRIYPWGNALVNNRLNYWNSGDPFENAPPPKTTPVGYYNGDMHDGYQTQDSPSPFGAYDMAGNVWEWCRDWYQADYYSSSPYSNPTGPISGTYRVIRGGSWVDDPYYVRTSYRSFRLPDDAYSYIGFRCVK